MKRKVQMANNAKTGAVCVAAALLMSAAAHGRTVNASDFGYSADNSTAALQAAINSGADKVIVDTSRGEDWCINPVRLRSNLELVFAANVKVRAMPGAYKSTGTKMFNAMGVTNLVVRGEPGASLSMCKRDYLDATRYKWSEWRHLLALYDSTNVTVSGLSISSAGGDGIYITGCKDIHLENLLLVDNNRQGLSVIGVDGLTVRRCRFTSTEGTPPACGLDFEPNKPINQISSVLIEDCEFDSNFATGVSFHLVRMTGKSDPVSVVLRRCRFIGNGSSGVGVHPTWDADSTVTGTVLIEDSVFAANLRGALRFSWMPPSGFKVKVRNSVLDCRGSTAEPIAFDNGIAHFDFGGVEFENVRILTKNQNAIEFYGMTGVGITNIFGSVDVVTPSAKNTISLEEFARKHPSDPVARSFKPASVKDDRLKPSSSVETVPAKPVFYTGKSNFVQYSPTAGERRIRFHLRKPEGARINGDVSVTVLDMKGTLIETLKLTEPVTEYVLRANNPNVHTFKIAARRNMVAVESQWNGRGILANTRVNLADMEGKNVYFSVPAKSKGFKMELLVKRGVSLSFKVLDSSGKVRAERSLASSGDFVTISREPTDEDEVWTLAVEKSNKPFTLRFGGNVTPVLFDDPAAGLRQ